MILGMFTELLSPGGIQRVGRHISAVLASLAEENGWSYRILSLNDPPGSSQSCVGSFKFAFQGFGRQKRKFTLAALSIAPRARVVLLGHPNLAFLGLCLRGVNPRLRYCVVVHGTDVWSPLSLERRLGLKAASSIISPSYFTAQQVKMVQKVPSSKIVVLPWAVDPAIKEHRISTSLALPSGRILLTVARLAASERYKGVDMVIQALPKVLRVVPNIYYVVVGDGDDRPRLERFAAEIGVQKRVLFMGRVASDELKAYYAACDVFVMPSQGEGFGIVFLEAMSFGKPVIGGNHGGTPDIVIDGATGFLVGYGDIDALADRLIRLLQDEKLRKHMGEAARRRVEENYTFERFRKRLVQLLSEVRTS